MIQLNDVTKVYSADGLPVTALQGVTLTVEPGVQVMGRSSARLAVLGHLQAVGTPSQPITFTSATDAGGAYTLSLPVGAYTLTVEPAPLPYYSAIVTDVSVLTDVMTMQNIALMPWPRWYFPLVTYDD